jgi:phosphoribosylamine--glycine ligase
MKVLVVGSGGREHALAWKLAQSAHVTEVIAVPGNPGIAAEPRCRCVAIPETDAPAIAELAARERCELAVVGPEAALVAGVASVLRGVGVPTVGPGADGARLEASKLFAKQVMAAAGVPTAAYAEVSSEQDVLAWIGRFRGPGLVVKADGLAAGKGVVVCDSLEEARDEALSMLRLRPFGTACDTLILEERLDGVELSFIVLTDGTSFVCMPTAQDHKRLRDGDTGPNTGGMGAYSPVPFADEALCRRIARDVIEPTLAELRRRGIDYRGFLYAGLMLTAEGPRVLEFNTRLGDPETQAIMLALDEDLVPVLVAAARGDLSGQAPLAASPSAVVVMAAAGYPEKPERGARIEGIDEASREPSVVVFHAGTRREGEALLVAGGRVLGVGARGATPTDAIRSAYRGVARICWQGVQYRRDVGARMGGA